MGAATATLNLTVIVDNSVIEIFANDEFALTTRVCVLPVMSPHLQRCRRLTLPHPRCSRYPWLEQSIGAGLLHSANGTATNGSDVSVSGLELWDGLGASSSLTPRDCLLLTAALLVRDAVNAWPERSANTSRGLVWCAPLCSCSTAASKC